MVSPVFIGPGYSLCCTIVSAVGVIFLFILGALFQAENGQLMHGEPDEVPKDPKAVARAAFIAGAIYAVLFGFCTCQFKLGQRRRARESI
ncbi:hypothetical protein BC832DRAFT_552533 [Gaertneriomyces semiglobifer]|nr:hypothetical protein BC832DRAFT_552533 [Gaertneriomyces semiglobifer]